MKRYIRRRAFGVKCGKPGSGGWARVIFVGVAETARKRSGNINEPSAIRPAPSPVLLKKARRVWRCQNSFEGFINLRLVLGYRFVQVEQEISHHRVGCKLGSRHIV